MRALGQHVTSKANPLSPTVSAPAIHWKRVALYVTLSLVFFLLGFLTTWLETGRAIEQRDAAQRAVRLGQLQNTLASAVIEVQRGQYEPARQLTSDFYTNVRRQIEVESGSVFTDSQRQRLRSLLAGRDELINLLSRSDPAATDRLLDLYSSFNRLTTSGS